ncbi:MAG: hypothetical protein KY458_15525 [Actinobacteria bacterium]|nr:hypothetical protein [Actinomycetota bacterium]
MSPVRLLALAAAALVLAVGCEPGGRRGGGDPQSPAGTAGPGPASTTTSAPGTAVAVGDAPAVEVTVSDRGRGGSARVGVWAEPDPAARTVGGSAIRALVLPQLFVARPDGRWSPALVAPGTDRLAVDRRSASFRLRPRATWSDGSALGVEDLRRSADGRFVAGVDDPAPDGTITVRFTQELPGWRRLWSANDSIAPPAPGVWGGPFVVAGRTAGLETVLRRNDRWWGPGGPFLDEIRLVLVPDPVTARHLLSRGELDVIMPLAATARRPQLERTAGVSVDHVARGGWSVSLMANPARMKIEDRRALFNTVDRSVFVGTLLGGEAHLINGFAGPEDAVWAGVGVGSAAPLKGNTIDLVGMLEEPMTFFLHRSMQKRARVAGGRIELRHAEVDRVEPWVREGNYSAAVVAQLEPLGGCWRCRWESFDSGLAVAADGGDGAAVTALQTRLRDEALVLPLWAPETVVAWRKGLHGPKANGFAATAAWNAWEWWRGP